LLLSLFQAVIASLIEICKLRGVDMISAIVGVVSLLTPSLPLEIASG
jgi:hypothetical protein